MDGLTRRGFMGAGAALFASAGTQGAIQGFDEKVARAAAEAPTWTPFSDRKVRIGIAGQGVCAFGGAFGYQDHPNAEVVACTDLDPKRCAQLQQVVRAKRTYASCEEMIDKARDLDAVYLATDAPSHMPLAIRALRRGLHVVTAVPALLGEEQLQYIPELLDAVRASGKVYQMNETSAFRAPCYAMRTIYEAGGFGELVYTEGEYYHNIIGGKRVGSYKGWRDGLPPQYYPTHSNGFYTCVTHRRFTEVTCIGKPSAWGLYKDAKNRYKNPYGSEFALFKTAEGGSARMAVAWDIPVNGAEDGRCWGEKGFYQNQRYVGDNALIKGLRLLRPALPPGMPPHAWHGGSHEYLTDDFLRAILTGKKPVVDVITALDTTVAGIYAHLSAMKGGETLKIPEFRL